MATDLHSKNLDSTEAKRDLSISLVKLGDCYRSRGQQGDATRALQCYEDYYRIISELYELNPDNSEVGRELCVALERLGDLNLEFGELGHSQRALEYYQAQHTLASNLSARNPDSMQAQIDLSFSLNKLADFYWARGEQGDYERSLNYYQKFHKVTVAIYAQNPANVDVARQLSLSQERLGDFYLHRGGTNDFEQAHEFFISSIQIRKEIHSLLPRSLEAARDLSISQSKLGEVLFKCSDLGNTDTSVDYLLAATQTLEAYLIENNANAELLWLLVTSHWNIVMAKARIEDSVLWRRSLTRAHGLLRWMRESNLPLNENCEKILSQLDQIIPGD